MPEVNGFEVLQWVRSNEDYKNIPFIMVTAQAEKKDSTMALDTGANNFITKPFTFEELKYVLRKTFNIKNRFTN